ncbi:hypothetical protein PAXRUDRAFT_18013 [Paxillus rubicundulus Ve08.2h10]|uniref:Uncharacterized protein n=1 Tax=Paxillus rubicundulus Ve08.2h10 TaxID=930991 RepID=A0A0D0CN11_9AGAM|nr:hypothetical protein PAXRUDRAFT_18013 [Paxillus rubicundulus Ve08.2h10]
MAVMSQEAQADEDFPQDGENEVTLIAVAIVGEAEISRQIRIENRFYLCCPQLLPNPRLGTPWKWREDLHRGLSVLRPCTDGQD